MFEQTYRSMNEQIRPDGALINDTIRIARGEAKPHRRRVNRLVLKPALIAAALMVSVLASVPVLAANVPAAYELVYLLSPKLAQHFVPIQESCEDNGIRMEVLATYIHDNTAEILVSMQDLTGDRIDETTDLYDSYSIHRAFPAAATCSFLGFDSETKVATFLINITELGDNHRIEGERLTFSVRHFISGKRNYDDIPIDLDLSSIGSDCETIQLPRFGWGEYRLRGGSGSGFDGDLFGRAVEVVQPGGVVCSPVSGIDITGAGYVDGLLHIQTAVTDLLKNDNHGELYLMDRDGNYIKSTYTVSFFKGKNDERTDYTEYVFGIGPDGIAEYSLRGSFVIAGNYTEGRWRVTFPLVAGE
jgi:hypothetical protein